MKVVLFCGGLGMRLRDVSDSIPKPMVEIGYRPVLWHVMKYYAAFGHKDFILCLGDDKLEQNMFETLDLYQREAQYRIYQGKEQQVLCVLMCVCVYVCMYVCLSVCMYVCVCMHEYIYIYIYEFIQVCMYVCM